MQEPLSWSFHFILYLCGENVQLKTMSTLHDSNGTFEIPGGDPVCPPMCPINFVEVVQYLIYNDHQLLSVCLSTVKPCACCKGHKIQQQQQMINTIMDTVKSHEKHLICDPWNNCADMHTNAT